MICIDSMTLRR